MVIPMKGQYEQQCNAAALKKMGIPVIKSLKLKHLDIIKHWLNYASTVSVDYPDITESIIDELLAANQFSRNVKKEIQLEKQFTPTKNSGTSILVKSFSKFPGNQCNFPEQILAMNFTGAFPQPPTR